MMKFTDMGAAVEAMTEFYNHCIETFRRKNKGYADTESSRDVLKNFREEAADEDISMLRYARIMRKKHEKAWRTFVMTGSTSDRPWRILKDRVVYSLIEYLICLDEGLFAEDEVLADTGDGA